MRMLVVRWIDYTLMTVLSFFCLAYISHMGKSFAEINVQFPFLNFPVFVGEFLLMGCVVLFLVRTSFCGIRLNRWWALIILYVCFFMVKAGWGYNHYGPLAFRHAALFYYFLFAVIAYHCYRPEFFKWWVILIYFGALHWMFFSGQFYDWWMMPRIFMGLILAYKFPNRLAGMLLAASVLVLTPYQYFLQTSRSIILANFASVSFLILAAGAVIGEKKRSAFLIGSSLLIILFGWYVFYMSGNKYAQGLVSIDKLKYLYEDTDMIIQQKKDGFKAKEIANVGLYNPETSRSFEDHYEESVLNETVLEEPALTEPQVPSSSFSVVPDQVASPEPPKDSNFDDTIREMKIGNSVFRLLIWRDAKKELIEQRPLFGFDFGKPFRSESLEIVRWGMNDWGRDGWIAMHNSYLETIYRGGIVGIALMTAMVGVFVYCTTVFIRLRSAAGLLLCATLIIPLVAATFSVSLELPSPAIPIWTLFGLILAYAHRQLGIHMSMTGSQRT